MAVIGKIRQRSWILVGFIALALFIFIIEEAFNTNNRGGGSKNKSWMQLIADITNRKIITTSQPVNAGAIGAAMCAMVGSGIFKDFSGG